LPSDASDQAAGIFNIARTIGGSIGIAIAATVLTRTSQGNWQTLGAGINPYNPALGVWLNQTGLSISDPSTGQIIGMEIARQSTLLGFIASFGFVMMSFLLLIPFVLLLTRGTGASQFALAGNVDESKSGGSPAQP
jgi:DHA2 family multidrug resistance protein